VRERTKRKRKTLPALLSFNHAMVYVRELAPALRFCADLLGFQVIEQFGPAYARLRSARGQTTLALHTLEPGQALAGTDGVRLYFETSRVGQSMQGSPSSGRAVPAVAPGHAVGLEACLPERSGRA